MLSKLSSEDLGKSKHNLFPSQRLSNMFCKSKGFMLRYLWDKDKKICIFLLYKLYVIFDWLIVLR